ncbi:MAG: VPS10 domain-containing protein, partial [Bacteroidota bacterium]
MYRSVAFIVLLVTVFISLTAQKKQAVPPEKPSMQNPLLATMKARSIGPAIMGGRVSDIAFDPKDIATFYVALGTGGVMKSDDNGASFSAIFEKEEVAAVGAVAVSPMKNKFVWVGTGEANDRNSTSWGNGVYLSSDGGGSWKNVGLRESKSIARIVLHPRDTNTAYVAAMGDLWNLGGERGLYKTTDAGKSWQLVLGAPAPNNTKVGCGDVMIDTTNPNIVYAALYGRQRTPWSFTYGPSLTDGKDAGGIFKSTDGGTTWKKLENGLPKMTGRIGLSIYQKNPNILYSVVQSDDGGTSNIDDVKSKNGGVFMSSNAGETWSRVNPLNPRPFYFSQIRIDPSDSSRIYILGFILHVSLDGGKTFREDYFKGVHA